MAHKKRILIKLTGNVLVDPETGQPTSFVLNGLINQIKQLHNTHQFGLVIGGGNLFRGHQHGTKLGLTTNAGHHVGMLATTMNGLIIKDLLDQHNIPNTLFSAFSCPQMAETISHHSLAHAINQGRTLIFSGGTGNPFFTTDTNALLRGLQIQADEVWKGTNVDGIYDADPVQYNNAKRITSISYQEALEKKIGIMDATAYALGKTHKQRIRIFNIFEKDVLLKAARNKNFGSIIE